MAGLTGGRVNHFNITKQAKDYDLEGHYVRTWLPELRNVPSGRIHEPWLMGKEEQARCGAVPVMPLKKGGRGSDSFTHLGHMWHGVMNNLTQPLVCFAWPCRYGVQIGVDYPAPIPAARLGRPHGGGRGGGGAGGGSGRGAAPGGGRGPGNGSSGNAALRGGDYSSRPSSGRPSAGGRGAASQYNKSEFERFG